MNKARWDSLLESFGIEDDQHTYNALLNAYAEKHRCYHTREHIEACLAHLDSCELTLSQSHELEMAFWFHDAIYKICSGTNEEDSAVWAVRYLQERSASPESIERVERYILDTKHNVIPVNNDSCVLVDIDIAILGAAPAVYEAFENAIAREYKVVPKMIYRKKRKAVLTSFADKAHIYHTEYYQQRFENQARTNLQWAIDQLA